MSALARVQASVHGRAVTVQRRPGPGPALVLIHGAGGAADTWAPLLPHLARYDLWLPDLPGRGGSPGPVHRHVAGLAAWLAHLLDDLGLQRPIVLGHSMGGAVALELSLQQAQRGPGGLVLVASGARLRVAPSLLAAAAAATDDAPLPLDFAFAPGTPPRTVAAYAAACRGVPAATALADWQACDAFDRLGQLDAVPCPALVVHGTADLLTPPRHQRVLEDGLPTPRRVPVEGAGHMLPWESPGALAAAVEAWTAGLGLR